MILAEITNFMCGQLLALRPSLNKWSDAIKHFLHYLVLVDSQLYESLQLL